MVDLNDSKINVLLLAAGLGTRLRPLTDHTPKCLVPIGGRPILKVWIDKLSRMNRVKILINTHHLSTKVEQYVNSIKSGYSNDIYTVYEPELLGTAGTIIANEHFFDSELNVVIHADNATDFDLQLLLDAHRRRPKRCLLTMVTFNTEEPSSCGIVEIDTNQILVNFHEKKADPPGNRANAAIYAFDRAFVDYLFPR